MARRRRSRKRNPETEEELFHSDRDERMDRRRARRGLISRKWMILFVLFLALLFFFPTLIVKTPLKQVAIDKALSKFKGNVTIENIDCGWIANTRLTNVVANDENGDLLFKADLIRIPKSLTSMWGAKDFGKILILNPVINLRLRENGSNLEDAIAELIRSDETDSEPVGAQVNVENGMADVLDEVSGTKYQILAVNSQIDLYQATLPPLNASVQGKIKDLRNEDFDAAGPGTFEAKLQVDPDQPELSFNNGFAEVKTEKVPLDFVGPLVTRFVEPMRLNGMLTGAVHLKWKDGGSGVEANVSHADIKNLRVAAPGWLGNDQIALRSAWLNGKVKLTPNWLSTRDVEFRSEVANVSANGRMDWQQLASTSAAQIPANDFHAEGNIQLAQLAAMLPETLRLQKGLQIESGTIDFNADSRVDGTDRRLVVNVESKGLTAVKQGQRLNWHKPARIAASIRQTPDNLTILDTFQLTTNFLNVTGEATKVAGEFTVQGDLEQATNELKQFFDFGDVVIRGNVDGKLGWRFDGNANDALTSRPLSVGGRFKIDQPVINLPGQPAWSEDEMNVVLQASGQMLPQETVNGIEQRPLRIDFGKLELVNARQMLEAKLVEPMMNPSLQSNWKLDCRVAGDIRSWLTQIQTFTGFRLNAAGVIEANGRLFADLQNIYVREANYKLTNFKLEDYGLTVVEPSIEGQAEVDALLGQSRIEIPGMSLRASSIGANIREFKMDYADQVAMDGQVAFVGDINRLTPWLGKTSPDAVQWYGQVQGTIDLKSAGNLIDGKVDMKVNDLVGVRRAPTQGGFQNASNSNNWIRVLEEKEATLDSVLQMSDTLDRISFQNLNLNSSAVQVSATGEITELTGAMKTNVQGNWSPDWQRLKPLVDTYLGSYAQFQGVQGGRFSMQGPVFNPESGQPGQPWLNPNLQIRTAASWQQANVLGLPVGGSNVNLQVADGIAAADTGAIPFSNGQVTLSPRIDMRGEQMMLSLVPGTVVDRVQLSPEICRGWMKFVAPVLADATAVEGTFSVSTSNVNVPIAQPTMGQIQGTATMHGANVGPGPLGQQLMTIVSQVKALSRGEPLAAATASQRSWLVMPEQQVNFVMQQGRVYHQALQFQIDDVIVKTSGSVGLDQTMQMEAEVPIQDSWVGTSRWTQGLKGQTLKIPIGGTVTSPQIDNRMIQQLSSQLLQSAASSAVNNEVQGLINKGNEKLENEVMKGLGRLLGGDR